MKKSLGYTIIFLLFALIIAFAVFVKYMDSVGIDVIHYVYKFILHIALLASVIVISVMGTIIVQYSRKFNVEGANEEKLKSIIGKYISKDVLKNVVEKMENVTLGGKRAEVTILFTDIRDFTRISEDMKAEELSQILNEHFSLIEPIIRKYDGVVNKFLGDSIMAIFGEPVANPNHALNAVKCSQEILKRIKELQSTKTEDGKPKIDIGIGINTGMVFVGNVGTEERFEYTVIGDAVNIASRIESFNRIYKTKCLISENTYNAISEAVDVIKISDVSIRGKAKNIDIYEVLRIIE